MVRSPISAADAVLRRTIEHYQATFNRGDREGWLALFTDDGVLEDPAGSPGRQGREELGAFWHDIHRDASNGLGRSVRMVQGPAVCGLEAAWAFELTMRQAGRIVTVEIIDQAVFAEDGRVRRLRAFWNEGTVRVR